MNDIDESRWREVVARLRDQHPDMSSTSLPLGNKRDPYDELVYILLTVMTRSQPRIDHAYEGLLRLTGKRGWSRLLDADDEELTAVLEPLGFVNRRRQQLLEIAHRVEREHGGSLDFLQDLADEEALEYLMSLPGVGYKTAKCVLMYSLDREVLPVDIHVLRVAKRLGLVEESTPWKTAEQRLEDEVPDQLKFDVHVGLVIHGREICKGPNPQCEACLLLDICPTGPRASRLRSEYV